MRHFPHSPPYLPHPAYPTLGLLPYPTLLPYYSTLPLLPHPTTSPYRVPELGLLAGGQRRLRRRRLRPLLLLRARQNRVRLPLRLPLSLPLSLPLRLRCC